MHESVIHWLGHELVALSAESTPGADAGAEMDALYEQLDARLGTYGLSLADTVRSRTWAIDRDSRDQASKVRSRVLSGPARSSSSSYIAPDHFTGSGRVAADVLAWRSSGGSSKQVFEHDPPEVPLRYCTAGSLVVLSGVTAVLPSLAEQMADILATVGSRLDEAGAGWAGVAHLAMYHHRSVPIVQVERELRRHVSVELPEVVYVPVDGYSRPGKLIEIEATATTA